MWVKDTHLCEMEKGWKIIPMSYKACEMEWVMGRDNEPTGSGHSRVQEESLRPITWGDIRDTPKEDNECGHL